MPPPARKCAGWSPAWSPRRRSATIATTGVVWFKHRAWIPVAWFLSGVNLVSVWFAAQPAEPLHATIHALLAVLLAVGALRLSARQEGPTDTRRLDQLQQSVDTIAVEIERISEGQRFVTKMLGEKERLTRE